jgi:hypothetical protein
MRTFGRTLGALALAALLALLPAGVASAKKKPKVDAFAAKYHLKGTWRAKDIDRDGLKNLKEFKLGTNPRKADTDGDKLKDADEVASGNNPRKADTDGDKVKDGAEHAGVVTAFDGETVTLRQFNGPTVTATLDTSCQPADDASLDDDDDSTADDSSVDDGDAADEWDDDFTASAAQADDDDDDVDVDEDGDEIDADSSSCDDSDLKKGAVLQSAALERDGGEWFLAAFELA